MCFQLTWSTSCLLYSVLQGGFSCVWADKLHTSEATSPSHFSQREHRAAMRADTADRPSLDSGKFISPLGLCPASTVISWQSRAPSHISFMTQRIQVPRVLNAVIPNLPNNVGSTYAHAHKPLDASAPVQRDPQAPDVSLPSSLSFYAPAIRSPQT